MTAYEQAKQHLGEHRYRWLVTGAAGFIGSNLLETLLRLDQDVVGLDNFATGFRANLDQVRTAVGADAWGRCRFVEGDIRNAADCSMACEGVDFVLHQAALGSVPRSIADPKATHEANVDGFVNMLIAARDAKVKRFVYASSSSVYGDHPELPKVEDRVGKPLSPYAVTKCINEIYAEVFARTYGMATMGLRYFNVFGPRQDPNGAYAAVIPRWIAAMIENRPVRIFGDGETSRDFCYVDNAVQVNLLAALSEDPSAFNQVFNVAVGDRISLNQLFDMSKELLISHYPHVATMHPQYDDFRLGDVRHSQADISKAKELLGYAPSHGVADGLRTTMDEFVRAHNEAQGHDQDDHPTSLHVHR
jgi:UDP-N-acetylglucosamine 4-epimerase